MTTKAITSLFRFASQEQAEKLVIYSSDKELSCRCHLPDGEEALFKLPKKLEADLASNLRRLLKIAPDDLVSGKYCKINDKNCQLSFHLSIVPENNGEKIIISVLKNATKLNKLSQLGWQTAEKNKIKKILNSGGGLIIFSSPTRQGRSTTLYAALSAIDQEKKALYFLGKNPEFNITGLNCLDGARSDWEKVLKHDSDVIALDSNNEADWRRALTAAGTGRLVLMTMEAVNSLEVLYKLLDLGLPARMITDNLKLISGQALVDLKRRPSKSQGHSSRINKASKVKNREQIGIFELLTLDNSLKQFISDNKNDYQNSEFWKGALSLALKNDYRPMKVDWKQKKKDGLT